MDSWCLPVWRLKPQLWRHCLSISLWAIEWQNSTFLRQNRAVWVLTGGPISHMQSLHPSTLLGCQDGFLNSFFWFLKVSWHCLCPFGLAGLAFNTSLSMNGFIWLASSGLATLKMVTCTWRSCSVSFVYGFVSVDSRSYWLSLGLSSLFWFFLNLHCLFEKTACDSEYRDRVRN